MQVKKLVRSGPAVSPRDYKRLQGKGGTTLPKTWTILPRASSPMVVRPAEFYWGVSDAKVQGNSRRGVFHVNHSLNSLKGVI